MYEHLLHSFIQCIQSLLCPGPRSSRLQARQLLGPGLPQVNEEIMKAARAGIFQVQSSKREKGTSD